MNKTTTIGLDLAKNMFHVVGCDQRGKIIRKKMLRKVLSYFANLEACASAISNTLRYCTLLTTILAIVPKPLLGENAPFPKGNSR